jgi:hypothetical protein
MRNFDADMSSLLSRVPAPGKSDHLFFALGVIAAITIFLASACLFFAPPT